MMWLSISAIVTHLCLLLTLTSPCSPSLVVMAGGDCARAAPLPSPGADGATGRREGKEGGIEEGRKKMR
jgi:hypothetical protein